MSQTSDQLRIAHRSDSSSKVKMLTAVGGSGNLGVVGSIPTVGPYVLPVCLASFNRKFPQIRVTGLEEFTTELLDRLERGAIDLAVLALLVTGGHFVCQEVLREPVCRAAARPPSGEAVNHPPQAGGN